jgi:hypothetical protein
LLSGAGAAGAASVAGAASGAGAAGAASAGAANTAAAVAASGAFASSPFSQPDNKAIATKPVAIIILVFIVDPIYFEKLRRVTKKI